MTINEIRLDRAATARILIATICVLALAHIGVSLVKNVAGYPTVYGLVPLFDLNAEQNVPTYFNASLHLFSSLLLAVIMILKKRSRDPYAARWTVLCCGFLFMAFDEAAGLHELMERPMQELLGDRATGVFHFAWVIPGMLIVLFFAIWFVKFLLHLPRSSMLLFLLSGGLFIGGAVGVELFEGRHAALHGSHNLTFDTYVLVEETLEMVGLTVFIYALLGYLEEHYGEVRFRLAHSAQVAPRTTQASAQGAASGLAPVE
jgi:hypothetical protein